MKLAWWMLVATSALGAGCARVAPPREPATQPKQQSTAPESSPFDQPVAELDGCDIVIDGPIEDQRAIRSFLAHLASEVARDKPVVPSPFGESDAFYKGNAFWDADLWVFPALAFVDPERAKSIARYRIETMRVEAWRSGAWEVSRDGRDVTPPSSKLHASGPGAYAFGLSLAAKLGLAKPSDADTARKRSADYYTRQFGIAGIKGVRSIDEYAEKVDRELFTTLVANWSLGKDAFALVKTTYGYANHAGPEAKSIQQASAVLSIWPLQDPWAEAHAKEMMERYAPKVNPAGPAMSDSVHALIWARLGETEKAYAAWRTSWMDFTDDNLEFREYRKRPERTYFLTGAAGCLNTVVYGFLGFRIDSTKTWGAAWSKEIIGWHGPGVLSVKPNLPQAWKSVEFRNFRLFGKRYTLRATHTEVRVIEGD